MKRTERGWIGHFVLGYRCLFRRNTLLEHDNHAIVVSTVGWLTKDGSPHSDIELLGCYHYYETMVYHAKDNEWKDADVERGEINLDIKTQVRDKHGEKEANDIHENVVDILATYIQTVDEIFDDITVPSFKVTVEE
jgi:hypothetical protein